MLTEKEVNQEVVRSRHLHGPMSREHGRVAKILMREVLEAAQEEAEVSRLPRLSRQRTSSLMALRSELVQVVAVAAQWVANIDNEREREENEQNANSNSAGGAVRQ